MPLGKWNYSEVTAPTPYGCHYSGEDSYRLAAEWLDGPGVVEDWGCGTTYAKQFFKQAEYRGIDGNWSRFADIVVDLKTYTPPSKYIADYILMRHVLEHNTDWRDILDNALHSFTQRMALVLFTPMEDEDTQIGWHAECGVPDLSLCRNDLLTKLSDYDFEKVPIGIETLFKIKY